MGLNKVVVEIKENAKKEAERIIGNAEMEAENVLKGVKERVKTREKEMRKESDSVSKQIELRDQTITKIRAKELVLNTKKDIIESVYQEFLEYLKNTKGSERSRIFNKMFKLSKRQIEKPRIVYVRKEDMALARKLFRGFKVKTGDMEGGFILESEGGKELVDFRFESLVELLKGKTLKGVSKILFGG